jgi:hybrid polyketide synthase/nonribosomal peptide synthetase ACE1
MKDQTYRSEPIAIIGSGCRFPGQSTTPSKLWNLLIEPDDLSRQVPTERFLVDNFYHKNGSHHGSTNARNAYFLSEDVRKFDTRFFGIKPVEADAIDPQQRLLLEVVYESLENAGVAIQKLKGSDTAVYVGLMCGDYELLQARDLNAIRQYNATGVARSLISNRISYFFDWKGPSMTIDTACSSSLVAVHQAIQVLRNGSSRVAIAAGSNIILGPENYIAESKVQMLSPDGWSRMWDIGANGYARGEGVASIVLKTLSAAIEDGDHIECIIRESGINQDGRTAGITMPNAVSQANLIRKTYKAAGLDPLNPLDRCQYFESHGTGTLAGDPVEAEAISAAFFPQRKSTALSGEVLYVGSVKTVIGHTEGTAGLAGLLKASLAVQHGFIPPNLHFTELNPAIKPFYQHLTVPTAAQAWPSLPNGCPRRVSVNSFGFGGMNAHAIIESYVPQDPPNPESNAGAIFVPFVFSASSEASLAASLASYSSLLSGQKSVSLQDLAWTLHARRTALPVATAISAVDAQGLCTRIDEMLESWRQNPDKGIGNRRKADSEARRVLGIFTGQGAQWPAMGRLLLLSSDYCRRLLETLDRSLAELPEAERPSWSLLSELLVEGSSSRVKLAAFSQPICTAIQILLVDLLRSAGITFSAVVGHSSGEIAAAYAAGFISAYDAIRIAYYRGLNANAARGHNGQKGAMIAVGTSLKNAQELCELSEFKGRINVAACNSFSSMTISGDADAIDEAKVVFEDEKKFVRLLQVDTAYHSYHMQYCSDSNLDSLRKCNVTVETQPTNVSWFSSVYAGQIVQPTEDLKCTYWNENMVKPVFFAQALQSALMTTESFDIAVEVGPHPALKGPASQVMQDLGKQIPYCGLLKRGENDVEAFADGLGHLWTHMADAVGLGAFDNLVRAGPKCNVIKELPNYAWDHDRIYWHESRHSRALRLKNNPNHELLGRICPDSTEFEIRWRNFIRPVEIPWLTGHKLQGQIVFPAAAYVVLALESSKYLVKEEAVKLVEVQDFSIQQAMVFADDSTEIETLFSLVNIDRQRDMVQCSFRYYAATGGEGDEMILFAEGRLKVMINAGQSSVLPRKQPIEHNLVEVDIDRWYSFLDDVGYGFSLPFKPLESANRKLGVVTSNISLAHIDHSESTYLIHPTTLDAVMQALHLAYAYPEDGRFWSLHVPKTIERVRIDPVAYKAGALTSSHLQLAAHLEDPDSSSIYGHADLFSERNQLVLLQVEGFLSVPLSKASAADDNQVYMKVVWKATNPDGEAVALDVRPSDRECEVASVAERVSLYYLRNLDMEISRDHPARATAPYKGMFDFSSHVISKVSTGQHPYVKKEWLNDTYEDVMKLCARYPDNLDLRMLQLVEKFPDVIRGKTTMLEHMKQDNLLDLCYENAFGIPAYSQRLSRMVALFAHRYPHMNILEIGAGTGGVTKGIMKNLQGAFNVYTFTDISTGFFPTAAEVFKNESDKMIFKALDIEQDPVHQGFQPGSFDLVIASLVLHATRNLERTMTHVRQLLKPGGYLIAFEITSTETLTTGTIFGTLPGWWLGADDGRVLSPGISSVEWDTLLRKTGFSGIDSITPDLLPLPFPWSLFCSQAVDNRIQLLRTPLSAPQESFLSSLAVQDLLVIGGKTLKTSRLVGELSNLLRRYFRRIQYVKDLSDLQKVTATSATTVLSLTDIDGPVFKSLTPESFEGLKKVFEGAHPVLWVTQDSKVDPFMNMIVGFGRTQLCENPALTLQFLDIGTSEQLNSYIIAETLLRLAIMAIWAYKGTQSDILWSLEPEMALQRGNILIPRILDDPERNDRYNSSRRNISKYIDIQASSVQLKKVGNSYYLQEAGSNYMQEKEEGVYPAPLIRVSYSSLISFKLGQKKYSIVLGTVVDAAEQVIGLSEINGSVARLAENLFVPCRVPEGSEATFVLSAAIHLVASFILSHLSSGDLVIVHEPNHLLASAISKHAAQQGIKAIFSSMSTTGESQSLFLQPFSPQMRVITSRNDVSLFIDCTLEDITRANSSTFAPFLPNCEKQALAALLQRGFPISAVSGVKEMFRQALSEAERSVSPIPCLNIISSSEISALNTTNIWSVVDWVSTTTAPVSIETADSGRLFSGNKTYWLAGLTGLLGTSLCDWMLRHGARYIAFSSRCPKIDENWLASIRSSGAVVEVFSNDITNKRDLENLHANISKTLPPIGGVTHAAMVLEDTPIREMSFDSLMKVIKPKVEGAINLHELFLDANLDFFVMFSSTAAVMGNVGQANYSAANEFLTSLTTQRKRAGLAASLINIGPIIGVGYLMRKVSQASRDDILHYGGYKYLSERDFQQLFAEAVLAGRPGSNQDPEFITTGLCHVSPNDAYKPLWLNNPKFGHLVTQHVVATSEVNTGKSEAPAKSRLLNSKTLVEARQIIQDVFISNLENLLQMTITRPNQEQSVSAIRTDDLGIDSLIAVEIRSWFMKSLQINMPVLKILSGVSVDDIVDFALQNLPREFIPNIAEEPREVSIPSSAEASVLDDQSVSDPSQDSDPDIELDDISTSSKTGFSHPIKQH